MKFSELLLEAKKPLTSEQIYKLVKHAASGCRIIADGKVIYKGPTGDHGTLTKLAWKEDGPKFEEKLKTGTFSKIEIKERHAQVGKNSLNVSWRAVGTVTVV